MISKTLSLSLNHRRCAWSSAWWLSNFRESDVVVRNNHSVVFDICGTFGSTVNSARLEAAMRLRVNIWSVSFFVVSSLDNCDYTAHRSLPIKWHAWYGVQELCVIMFTSLHSCENNLPHHNFPTLKPCKQSPWWNFPRISKSTDIHRDPQKENSAGYF